MGKVKKINERIAKADSVLDRYQTVIKDIKNILLPDPEVTLEIGTSHLDIKKIKNIKEKISTTVGLWARLKDYIEDIENILIPDPAITFGPYKGTPISKLDPSYLCSLFANGILDKYEHLDLKKQVKKLLKKERI